MGGQCEAHRPASGPGNDGCLKAIGMSGLEDAEHLRMYTMPSLPGAQSVSESMGSANGKGCWSTSPEKGGGSRDKRAQLY